MLFHHTLIYRICCWYSHGESKGNVDSGTYAGIPDSEVELTEHGRQQARDAGSQLRKLIDNDDQVNTFHCSASTFASLAI
jgi:broad specificity phosphatase PhoE